MTPEEEKLRTSLLLDFVLFAKHILKIKTKSGGILPFELNKAQLYIHSIAEQQLEDVGYIRILILKGRQQGASTYVAGRLFWKVIHSLGRNARVIAHNTDTSNMLFNMTRTFYDKCPEWIKPTTRAASAKEYDFDSIDSSYRVSTAGSAEGGRGGTVQEFHGSEVGFWDKAEEIFAGMMQSIPSGKDMGGTEVFLESTANGPRGKFYDLCMDAINGKNEYILVFTPWFWQDEYSTEQNPKQKAVLDEEEKSYQRTYDLTVEQMLWRRYKISELGESKFKQEYPASAQEAFEYSEKGSFFDREKVINCAKPKDLTRAHVGAKIGALDPSGGKEKSDRIAIGYGDDIAIREIRYMSMLDPTQQGRMAEDYIDERGLDYLWVDAIGVGATVYSNLMHGRHRNKIRPFISSGKTSTFIDGKEVYGNRRAEAHGKFRDWIGNGDVYEIPDNQELINDICAPLETVHKVSGRIMVESKEDMRDIRGIPSPDGLDVCIMIKCEELRKSLTNRAQFDTVYVDYDPLNEGL